MLHKALIVLIVLASALSLVIVTSQVGLSLTGSAVFSNSNTFIDWTSMLLLGVIILIFLVIFIEMRRFERDY